MNNTNIQKNVTNLFTHKPSPQDNIFSHPSHKQFPLNGIIKENLIKNAINSEVFVDKSCVIKELTAQSNNSIHMNMLIPAIIKCTSVQSLVPNNNVTSTETLNAKSNESFSLINGDTDGSISLTNVFLIVILFVIIYYFINHKY